MYCSIYLKHRGSRNRSKYFFMQALAVGATSLSFTTAQHPAHIAPVRSTVSILWAAGIFESCETHGNVLIRE